MLDGDNEPNRPWHQSDPSAPPQEETKAGATPQTDTDMLDPDDLTHLHVVEWAPDPKVASFVTGHLRKPQDKGVHNHLKAECPCPSLEGRVALTPEIDVEMANFLGKFRKDPKKGMDRSWGTCQDKLLDVVGPEVKILDMAEDAKSFGSLISPEALLG
ncbi:hypothetical protein NDU88_005309 [Pleurodeles waltl]|uniref:Uncharacterized protein n=1 Tax=Pleurodeles waltl TaxID=8319 RepID=A0AAV7V634_PLEWA|nr:hypothetical protein NDU88_005309 [Pleurodeles waltl]